MAEPLDRADFDSMCWRRLKMVLAERIQTHLEALAIPAPTDKPWVTDFTRGRIRELKDLLALEQVLPQPADEGEPEPDR